MKTCNYYGAALLLTSAFVLPVSAWAHCQIPCGIYDDEARFSLMAEDITTIEKSMKQITELSAAQPINYNQLVRWIDNKDVHVDKLMEIVTQYFLTQRIVPIDSTDRAKYEVYLKQVSLLQQMLVEAMKCKQTTDLQHTAALTGLLDEFKAVYLDGHSH